MRSHENFEMMLVNHFIGAFCALVNADTGPEERTMGYYFVPAEDKVVAVRFVLWDDSQEEPKMLSCAELRLHRRAEGDGKPSMATFEVDLEFAQSEEASLITVDYSTEGNQPQEVAGHMAQSIFTAMVTGKAPPEHIGWINTESGSRPH